MEAMLLTLSVLPWYTGSPPWSGIPRVCVRVCACTSEWRLSSGELACCSRRLVLMRDRWLLSVSPPAVHHPSVSLQCNNTKQSDDESCGCKVHGPSYRVFPGPPGKALFGLLLGMRQACNVTNTARWNRWARIVTLQFEYQHFRF